jgi:hypothetical protein
LFVSPRTRLVLIFAGKAVGLLIAISVLWSFFIAMPYNRALVAVTDRLSKADIILAADFDEEVRQQNSLEEDYICIASRQPGEILLYGYIPGSALHYGMLLVIALIAATPALGRRRRFIFIPLAILIMFLVHLITILVFARLSFSGVAAPQQLSVILFITLGTALFPALVWGVLCYKYWWPRAV